MEILPGGILIGLMFPMGVEKIADNEMNSIILADAIGTFISYTLLKRI